MCVSCEGGEWEGGGEGEEEAGESVGLMGLLRFPWAALMLGLLLGIVGQWVGRGSWRSRFPTGPIVLLISCGLGLLASSLLHRWSGLAEFHQLLWAETWTKRSGRVVVGLALPPLLFDAAFRTNVHNLRRFLPRSLLLALGTFVVPSLVLGFVWWICLHLMPLRPWDVAFSLCVGLCLAVSDPRDVWGFLEDQRLPQSLASQLESEHLIGVSLGGCVLLGLLGPAGTTETEAWDVVLGRLGETTAVTAVASVMSHVLGRFLVWLGPVALRDHRKEIALHYATSNFVWAVTQSVGGSGCLPVIALGLAIRARREKMEPKTYEQLSELLRLVAFWAQTVVYAHVGLVLNFKVDAAVVQSPHFTLWAVVSSVFAVFWSVGVVRLGLVGFLGQAYYFRLQSSAEPPSVKTVASLVWAGGLKGPVGFLFAVLLVERSAGDRGMEMGSHLVLLVVAVQLEATLCLQALTLPRLFAECSNKGSSRKSSREERSLEKIAAPHYVHLLSRHSVYAAAERETLWKLVCRPLVGERGGEAALPALFPSREQDGGRVDHSVTFMTNTGENAEARDCVREYLAIFKGHLFHLWEKGRVPPATYRRLSSVLEFSSDRLIPVSADKLGQSLHGRRFLWWLGTLNRWLSRWRERVLRVGERQLPRPGSSVGSAAFPIFLLSSLASVLQPYCQAENSGHLSCHQIRERDLHSFLVLVLYCLASLSFLLWNITYLVHHVLWRLKREPPEEVEDLEDVAPRTRSQATSPPQLHPLKLWDLWTDGAVSVVTLGVSATVWVLLLIKGCELRDCGCVWEAATWRSLASQDLCCATSMLVLLSLALWLLLKIPGALVALMEMLRDELLSLEREEELLAIQGHLIVLQTCEELEQSEAFGSFFGAARDRVSQRAGTWEPEDELKRAMALMKLNMRTAEAASVALVRALCPQAHETRSLQGVFKASLVTLSTAQTQIAARSLFAELIAHAKSMSSFLATTEEDQVLLQGMLGKGFVKAGRLGRLSLSQELPLLHTQLCLADFLRSGWRQKLMTKKELGELVAELAAMVEEVKLDQVEDIPQRTQAEKASTLESVGEDDATAVKQDQIEDISQRTQAEKASTLESVREDDATADEEVKLLKAGQTLFKEGEDLPDGREGLYFVRFGLVEVTKWSPHAHGLDRYVLSPRSSFALSSVLVPPEGGAGRKSFVSAQTLTPCCLVRLPARGLRALFASRPGLELLLLRQYHLWRLVEFLRGYDPFHFFTERGLWRFVTAAGRVRTYARDRERRRETGRRSEVWDGALLTLEDSELSRLVVLEGRLVEPLPDFLRGRRPALLSPRHGGTLGLELLELPARAALRVGPCPGQSLVAIASLPSKGLQEHRSIRPSSVAQSQSRVLHQSSQSQPLPPSFCSPLQSLSQPAP